MDTMLRRTFLQQTLGSLLTFSLLETLYARAAFADKIKPITVTWLNEVNQLSYDLKQQKLAQVQWQAQVEALFARVDLPDLLRLVDFERLTANVPYVDNGALSLPFAFQQIEGVPTSLAFGKQIFALKQGRAIVPHGHNNLATAFLILKGPFHGRHYDRLEDEPDAYLITPTIDRQFGPGEASTISDYKDNVHWFTARSEPAFILNIHVPDVRSGSTEPTGRVYLDPNGEKLAGGLIRARRLNAGEAHALYG